MQKSQPAFCRLPCSARWQPAAQKPNPGSPLLPNRRPPLHLPPRILPLTRSRVCSTRSSKTKPIQASRVPTPAPSLTKSSATTASPSPSPTVNISTVNTSSLPRTAISPVSFGRRIPSHRSCSVCSPAASANSGELTRICSAATSTRWAPRASRARSILLSARRTNTRPTSQRSISPKSPT